MRKRNKTGRGAKYAVLSVLCTVLGVILAVMLCATAYVTDLLGQINYTGPGDRTHMSPDEWVQLLLGEKEPDATAPTLEPDQGLDTEYDTQIGGKDSGIVNILLVGQDRREGESRARSDAMILCTFNKAEGTLTMTSFLRDLWVEIPGYGNNRINAAYSAGGMPLLNRTLRQNFGIHVDGTIEVDFSQFSGIIDLMGGVEIELRQDEANLINRECGSDLREGMQLLDGEEALTYARIRKLDADSDFSRTNRQRKVLDSLIRKFRDSGLITMLSLLKQVMPMITTDMTRSRIMWLAVEAFPALSDLQVISQRIPADGAYTFATISGMSVIQADMEAARRLLEETLG